MTRVFLIYDTKYGNTKIAAEKIAEGLREVEGTETAIDYVKNINLNELANFDALVIGAPNHMGKPSRTILKFIDQLAKTQLKSKRIAVFDTYLKHERNFEKATRKMEKAITEKLPNVSLLTPGLSVRVEDVDGPVAEGELPKCIEFGKRIANQIKK